MSEMNKRCLLLVEDDVVIAFAEQRWLKEYGYNVTHVISGEEAVEYVLSRETNPDLILMDINLGEGIDGTEAARMILEHKDIPVVFLSSHTEPEIVARTEKITSYGYVVKDSGITVLDASIKMAFRLFESRQREQQMDRALVESETRFRRAMDGSQDGLWDWNLQNNETYYSDRFFTMLNYEPGELPNTGEAWYGLIHPEDKDKALAVLQEYLDGKRGVYESSFRMKTKEGDYRWIKGRGKAVWDKQGRPVRITGTNTDVTDSYNSRASLEKSEQRYRSIFKNAKEAIMVADAETGKIRFANPSATALFGYSMEDLTEMSVSDVHADGIIQLEFPEMGEWMMAGSLLENVPCKRSDGEIFCCDVSSGSYYMNGKPHVIGYFYDLTELNQLRAVMQKEKDLFAEGPVSSFVWLPDEGWPVQYVSDNISGILGYSSDELMAEGFRYIDLIHPGDRDRVKKEVGFNSVIGDDCFDQSYRIRHKDGAYLWVLDFTRFYRGEEGQVLEIHGYMLDQSRLKEAENEILKQKERLSGIISGTNMGTWEWNLKTDEVVINDQWAEMLGYTVEELTPVNNDTWVYLTHDDDVDESNRRVKEHLEGRTKYYSCEIRMRHKNGSWVWILDKGKITEWAEDGEPLWMFGTQQDITERKENEKAIRQQLNEKEILLREVHHRIKNNMNSVSSLLKLQLGMDKGNNLNIIHKAIGRLEGMRVLYEKLLLSEKYKEIAVKPYMEDLMESIADIFPDNPGIRINPRIEDFQLNTKEIFPLGLIVNELITNSMKYAFGDRGKGTIIVDLARRETAEVVLTVSDNGKGLPENFSLENNSGFGLKLVRMLSKQLGGTLSIDNRDGVRSEIRYHSSVEKSVPELYSP